MKEEYRKAAFELFEELLIKYNLYSQFTTELFNWRNETLLEYFNMYFDLHCGDLNNFIWSGESDIYSEWINGLIKLREQYKIYRT